MTSGILDKLNGAHGTSPNIGDSVDVAIITPNNFRWIIREGVMMARSLG